MLLSDHRTLMVLTGNAVSEKLSMTQSLMAYFSYNSNLMRNQLHWLWIKPLEILLKLARQIEIVILCQLVWGQIEEIKWVNFLIWQLIKNLTNLLIRHLGKRDSLMIKSSFLKKTILCRKEGYIWAMSQFFRQIMVWLRVVETNQLFLSNLASFWSLQGYLISVRRFNKSHRSSKLEILFP